MNLISLSLFSFLVIGNMYSQDYITYDNYLQKARFSIHAHEDTVTSLKYYEKAFRYVNNPFSEHFYKYHQLICSLGLIENKQNVVRNYSYNFKSRKDKDLFFENNCHLEGETNSAILININQRLLIDRLFEKDQAIDRNSENKRELFVEVIDDFKTILETYGYPTAENIGLYINSEGKIVSSPVCVLIIHAVQNRDAYFLNNLEGFYERGVLLGSDYRMIKNLIGS